MSVRRPAATALCMLLAACATSAADDGARDVRNREIAPYGTQDECQTLGAGDRLDYVWRSDTPLDFDIGYRAGGAVVEPIVRKGLANDADVFVPALGERYCLTWEAGPAGAHLDYRIRVQRTSR